MHGFGPHLTIDMIGCDWDSITDLAEVFEFLSEMPPSIGMTVISQPHVFPYKGIVPKDAGVTGIVILAESHVSFHSFPYRDGYVFIDVFSCKDFDYEKAVSLCERIFKPRSINVNLVERGVDFPRD